uniref:Uncharacterized protein n=1 Tax=Plectus sambesii TaxID=2011161 RepID=A0A914WNZ7_9BILA
MSHERFFLGSQFSPQELLVKSVQFPAGRVVKAESGRLCQWIQQRPMRGREKKLKQSARRGRGGTEAGTTEIDSRSRRLCLQLRQDAAANTARTITALGQSLAGLASRGARDRTGATDEIS